MKHKTDQKENPYLELTQTDYGLIMHSLLNKGMGFTEEVLLNHTGPLLERYKDTVCSFNDDIQETAAASLSAILSALHITQTALCDQRIMIARAGFASCGIARMLMHAIVSEEIPMKKHTPKPTIFLLANSTSKYEANPEDRMKWTDGSAIIGTGSPFPPVDEKRIYQINHSYTFPGLGLGIISIRAKKVTEPMLVAAAQALSDCSPYKDDPQEKVKQHFFCKI